MADSQDLAAFYEACRGDGHRNSPFEFRMMVKVLFYAYAASVFSSRKIVKPLEEDMAFGILVADSFPSCRTICEFRRRHLGDIKHLFVQVVRLTGEMGLAKFDTLSVDGTKIRANASRRKAISGTQMKEAEIAELLKRARSADEDKDGRFGADGRGDAIKGHVKEPLKRLETIRAAKARLAARQREAVVEIRADQF